MAIGYFIRRDDRTSCGGIVIDAHASVSMENIGHSLEGDTVTCGVDGKAYRIVGGISYIISQGRRAAGSLDSVSSCPCRARLEPSFFGSSYLSSNGPTPSTADPYLVPISTRGPGYDRTPKDELVDSEIEEEEEEVEQEQLITLRIGVFFDGTGNNQANSESMAGCMAQDVGLQDQAEDIQRFCAEHGYGVDGSTPDNSYGNDTSNIARLYDLYLDQADVSIGSDAKEAALKAYIEGIGTVSGGEDALYGQATGRWGAGVLARVEQSPSLIIKNLRLFIRNNPEVRISRIELDVFGFSRGAAAARHFANDLLQGANSLLAKALPTGSSILAKDFAWQVKRDISLNFIGLFDTVPGIVSPLMGDFNPSNNRNSGLNLALPAGVARKVVQLVARDEHRLNFALIRTDNDIVLPGSHSDIGGGYRPRMRERLLVSKPTSSLEMKTTPNERSMAFSSAHSTIGPWVRRLIEQGVELDMQTWSVDEQRTRENLVPDKKHVYAVAKVDREVDGDLSKIYLRVMRELAVRHDVPFDVINEQDQRLALPEELLSISAKALAYTSGESAMLHLNSAEESLLLRRYIHLSASWNAVNNWHNSDMRVFFVNRPADDHKRISHANE